MATNSNVTQRIASLETSQHPDRFLVLWPEDNATSAYIHDWQAANPRGTVIIVRYKEDHHAH